ncbi:hypothetical protein H6781_00125 [Candidatus Nomurabacteria bacterium]|nr:hypothetical protein [Candidatus Nomurabacteria bacterium]
MTSSIKKGMRFRYTLLKYLPSEITRIIVKLKGTGVLHNPTLIKPENSESLSCTIAYNKYGAFCTPNLHKDDTPVQAVYRGEQYENITMQYISSLNFSGDIIHAGAYFGDSIPALSSFMRNNALIWAFEPNPLSFRCAEITILLNNISNVRLHNFGIADSNHTLNLLTTSQDGMRQLGGTARLVKESTKKNSPCSR